MTPSHQPQLFLCHSSVDKGFVHDLAADLIELGVDVWLDRWKLGVGDSLIDCISTAIASAAYVGVVISPDSVNSRWCNEELRAALAREIKLERKLVLPLLYRRVTLPVFLEDRLYIDFRRRRMQAVSELAAFLHGLNRRDVTVHIDKTKPRSIEAVKAILRSAGWNDTVYLPRKDYKTIQEILNRAGLPSDDDELHVFTADTKKRLVP